MATRKQPQQRNGFNAPEDPNRPADGPKLTMKAPSMPGSAPNKMSDVQVTDPKAAKMAASTSVGPGKPGMNPAAIRTASMGNPRPGMPNVYGDGIVTNIATNASMSLNPENVRPSGRNQGHNPLTHKVQQGAAYGEIQQLVPEQNYGQLEVAYNQMTASQRGAMAPNAMGLGSLPTQADMTPPPQDLTLQGVTSADPVAMQRQTGMNLGTGAQNQAPLNA